MNFEAVVYVVTYKLFFIKYYRYQSVTSGVIKFLESYCFCLLCGLLWVTEIRDNVWKSTLEKGVGKLKMT